MPLDGLAVKNIVSELNSIAKGGRIDKIYQPYKEDIIISLRANGKTIRLLVTSNASFPRMHKTEIKYENPQAPPMFCMMLRKHLASGRICEFFQPSFERIIEIKVESPDEFGDLSIKRLILEIMGKHSNIILVSDNGTILDCAKKISFEKSSVREVLPGKAYEYPSNQSKLNPLELNKEQFFDILSANKTEKVSDVIYKSYCGISPLTAVEICERAGVNNSDCCMQFSDKEMNTLFSIFNSIMDICRLGEFTPEIVYDGKNKLEFSPISLTQFSMFNKVKYDEISALLEVYYGEKAKSESLKQKTIDLRRLIENNIKRCTKKRDVLYRTLKDTENMDEWRICGELLTSYMSLVPENTDFYDAVNYYDENNIKRIRLNKDIPVSKNASRYFDKYNKAKRQKKAMGEQIRQNEHELMYLEGLYNTALSEITENEIAEIREELYNEGYIKKNPARKGIKAAKSKPMHYVSKEGYSIYVGKNNRQNDELTLKFAENGDIWLHAKDIPGSHVIIKTTGKEPGDSTLFEAAILAAYYSKAKDGSNVPVDYTRKKYVKKPNGSKPGMVIYDNNKTAYVTPSLDTVNMIKQG